MEDGRLARPAGRDARPPPPVLCGRAPSPAAVDFEVARKSLITNFKTNVKSSGAKVPAPHTLFLIYAVESCHAYQQPPQGHRLFRRSGRLPGAAGGRTECRLDHSQLARRSPAISRRDFL